MSHFTPLGCPKVLVSFLNIIELISAFLRPLTLALRLRMKMTAGHILITLLSTCVTLCFLKVKVLFFFCLIILSFFFVFEAGICVIQSFIFSLLGVHYLEG